MSAVNVVNNILAIFTDYWHKMSEVNVVINIFGDLHRL
jgi:hypothetical protein